MGMWSLNMSCSDEYGEAYDLFFAYYNSLESNDDLREKAYQIAEKIYNESLDDDYVRASTAFALLKSLHKIGFPYKLNPQEKKNLSKMTRLVYPVWTCHQAIWANAERLFVVF